MFYPSKFPHNPNVREFYSPPRSKSNETEGLFEKFFEKIPNFVCCIAKLLLILRCHID